MAISIDSTLKEQHRLFDNFFSNSLEAVMLMDCNDQIYYMNSTAVALTGYHIQEHQTIPLSSICSSASFELLQSTIREISASLGNSKSLNTIY